MSGKIFPIKTDTACRLKWSWSTLYLNNGLTSSCHRSSKSILDPEKFDQFHNTQNKIADRQSMLDGQWPGGGCEYCMEIEQAGGASDRVFQNKIPDIYPRELDRNAYQLHVQPAILEVFFSNTCNLKCIYCEPGLSSAIQAEDKKFDGSLLTDLRFEENNKYKQFAPKFWSWFEHNYHTLQRLQVLGGEPFLQKDLMNLLEFFDSNPCPNLEFNIVTNLCVSSDIVEKVSGKMADLLTQNKLGRVDIQASVDCWGSGQEYVRTGFNSALFDHNIKILIKKNVFRIGLLSTVCSLTIPEMQQLVKKYQEWSSMQEIFWYMHMVMPTDGFLSPVIFGSDYLVQELQQMYNSLPNETWDQKQTSITLLGIIKKIQQHKVENSQRKFELINYLNGIDKRRGLNWKNTFPWLTKECEHVVQ